MPSLADDRDAIRDLYARYCLHLDRGEAGPWAALYTDDGEFVGAGDHVTGQVALEAYAARLTPGTVHRMVVNHVIDVEVDVATCRASVLLIAAAAVVSSGRTVDRLRRVDGIWRIAHRAYQPD